MVTLWLLLAGCPRAVDEESRDPDGVDTGDPGDSAPVDSGDTGPDSGEDTSEDSAGETGDTAPPDDDLDDDGWTAEGGDCDDSRANVYPGAPEGCDALDQDCDGVAIADGACGEPWDPAVSASYVLLGTHEDSGLEILGVSGRGTPEDQAFVRYGCGHASGGGTLLGGANLAPSMADTDLPFWCSDNGRDYISILRDAGDLDGNGALDVVTWGEGAPETGEPGNVYVVPGPPDSWSPGTHDIRDVATGWWTDAGDPDKVNDALSGGDFSGDGVADLVVLTETPTNGIDFRFLEGGPAALAYGASATDIELVVTSEEYTDGFSGNGVAVLPDADGDGSDEIAWHDPYADESLGSIRVIEGEELLAGQADIEEVADWGIYPDAGGRETFTSLSDGAHLASDLDGDGYPEASMHLALTDVDSYEYEICILVLRGGSVPVGDLSLLEHARLCPTRADSRFSELLYAARWIPDIDGDTTSDLYVNRYSDGGSDPDNRECVLRTGDLAAGGVYDDYEPDTLCFRDEIERDVFFTDLTGDGLPEWIFSEPSYDSPEYGTDSGRLLIMEGFDIPFDDPAKW